MLKNEKSANRNDHQNRKTEVFCNKNRKTDLKNNQNAKPKIPMPPSVNDLCDFHDLYTSLSVTFVMYFNGRNKDIYYYHYYYYSWASFFSFIPRIVSHLTSSRILPITKQNCCVYDSINLGGSISHMQKVGCGAASC